MDDKKEELSDVRALRLLDHQLKILKQLEPPSILEQDNELIPSITQVLCKVKESINMVAGYVTDITEKLDEIRDIIREYDEEIADNLKVVIKKLQLEPSLIERKQEQFKREIDVWRKEDEKFVDTAGAQYVMKCIEENGCVSVIGNSGSGKTFTARHTALQMEKKGYLIIPLSNTLDLSYIEHDHKTLFVNDDLCGKFTLNEQYLNDWKRVLEKIESFLKDPCCKIIATCRLQVYQDVKFKQLSVFSKSICNLSSRAFSLTHEDIKGFKDSYLSDEDGVLPELSKDIDFYPLLFSLYKGKENRDINTFFSRPFECYTQELDNLEDEGPGGRRKYCGLVLCVLFNNTLCKQDILGQTSSNKHAIENILLECGVEKENRFQIVKDIEALQGYFVKIVDDKFKIIHDKLFDFLAKYFGTKMIENFIKHAHFDFISKRFLWKGSNIKGKKLEYIELCDEHINLFIDRMIDIWKEGYTVSVFHNSNVLTTSNRFRERFYKYLSGKPELEQEQLVRKLDNKSLSTPLFYASKINDVRGVKWMLEFPSIDVNQPNIDGLTPLHIACYNNNVDVVRELLKIDQIDVDVCENEGDTSLHLASQEGNADVVRLLLHHTVNMNKPGKYGWTPLHKACYNNHIEVIQELLKSDHIDVDVCDNDGDTSLHLASQKGNADVVRLLLHHSVNINKQNKNGWTPLHIACYNNHIDVVNELLKSDKIDVDVCENEGNTSLHFASQEGNADVVRLLLQHSANINKQNKDGWTPLHIACYYNHVEVVTELLKSYKIDCDACSNDGETSLYLACQKENADVVRLLLQHSANINKATELGLTPLIGACQEKHVKIVQELLKWQADINAKMIDGENALISASIRGATEIVELLLHKGSNPNACMHHKSITESILSSSRIRTVEEDSNIWYEVLSSKLSADLVKYLQTKPKMFAFETAAGSSSLHFASLLGYVSVAKLLIQYQADVNLAKKDGTTPLFYACEFGQTEIAKLLLHEGANTAISRTDGMKPLDIATENGHSEVVACLMGHDKMFSDM